MHHLMEEHADFTLSKYNFLLQLVEVGSSDKIKVNFTYCILYLHGTLSQKNMN